MIAVDTNVILRLIVSDDLEQRAAAEARLAEGFFVSHGVLMEAEWVLRSYYRLTREQINRALRALLSLQTIRTPQLPLVLWALDRHARGADFDDMLHLIAARGIPAFASFQRHLAELAGADSPVRVERLE